MRKNSAMGGGEFEFNPDNLEEKIDKRMKFFKEKHEELEKFLTETAFEYSRLGLGDFDNCKKELLRRTVLKMRGEK
ncbi:MAG: hypothetical protein ACRC1T_05695 [Clostridium chrysemydis]|uniref:hypothetical protein n=1 Tax=Clostridium chrysemydis TaxID=2665504 RepID=UPI003F3DD304